jgi:AcrR family transcriptional regulator
VSLKQRAASLTRAQRSQEISGRILETSLLLTARDGVDALSMQSIAAAAQLSNGPLYGRYDSPEDIVLDLWDTVVRAHLATIFDDLLCWMADTRAAPPERLVNELARPSMASNALIEILAVIRRYPFAGETIRTELTADLEAFADAQPTMARSLVAGQVSVILGTLLLAPLFEEEQERLGAEMLTLLGDCLAEPAAHTSVPRQVPSVVGDFPAPDTGDHLVDAFVSAVILVVAQTGFDHATTHRIARVAKHSYSSSYPHFASKEELMCFAMRATIDEIFAFGILGLMDLPEDERLDLCVGIAQGICDDEQRLWRQLRVETLIAGRHHGDVAQALREHFARYKGHAVNILAPEILGKDPKVESRLIDGWHLVRTESFGLSLLASCTSFTNGVEWTPAVVALFGHVEKMAFDVVST